MSAQVIAVHVEELVLEGFPGLDRYAVGAAFERELSRLLGGRDVWRPPAVNRLDGGSFEVPRDASPAEVGTAIGRRVYRGLGS